MSMAGISGVNNPSCSGNECVRSRESASCLDVEAWMPSEMKAIAPLVDRTDRTVAILQMSLALCFRY
jgi:hypothetical protein